MMQRLDQGETPERPRTGWRRTLLVAALLCGGLCCASSLVAEENTKPGYEARDAGAVLRLPPSGMPAERGIPEQFALRAARSSSARSIAKDDGREPPASPDAFMPPALPVDDPEPFLPDLEPEAVAPAERGVHFYLDEGGSWPAMDVGLDFLVRAFYVNDQRLEFSGMEETFGVEGALAPVIARRLGDWNAAVVGDFFFNQPFDDNQLADTAQRRSYLANFNRDPFEISNLFLQFERGNWRFTAGKFETPFGRRYFPLLSNERFDAPFIRTEAIEWRETGIAIRYRRGPLVGDVALTNGGEDKDTNSSKALVARLGLEGDGWALGGSVKQQDGQGSEAQKQFNNHVGVDFLLRRNRWIISGEAIYDEYGFRKPGFDPNDITWPRSIYFRDWFYKLDTPITGVGYYIDLGYEGPRWTVSLNYGEFYPKEIGFDRHDQVNRRGIVKALFRIAPGLQAYGVAIIENEGYKAQDGRPRKGEAVLVGIMGSL